MASTQMLAITIDPQRDPDEAARINARVGEFRNYCLELVEERRRDGQTEEAKDLVSAIAHAEYDGHPVPDGMAISFIQTFFRWCSFIHRSRRCRTG